MNSVSEGEVLATALLQQTWIFAKTMPTTPHEYCLRKNWHAPVTFDWAVETLRRLGYEKPYGRRSYTYFDAGGYTYWTMGAPTNETILINRKVAVKPA